MKNLMNEYEMLKKRIEKVSDYNYALELKATLKSTLDEVWENDRTIKWLEKEHRMWDEKAPVVDQGEIQKSIAFR